MPKKVEQLYYDDLKIAFERYVEDFIFRGQRPNRKLLNKEFNKFWYHLKNKCSVVESSL